MKNKILFLIFLVLTIIATPFVSADNNQTIQTDNNLNSNIFNYKSIISSGEKIILPFGTAYLIYPKNTYFGETYNLILGIEINSTNKETNKEIILNDFSENIKPEINAENTPTGASFIIYHWVLPIWDLKNPSLVISENGIEIFQKNFLFKAEKRIPISTKIINSEKTIIEQKIDSPNNIKAYNANLNNLRVELFNSGLKYSKLEFEQMNKKAMDNFQVIKQVDKINETYADNQSHIKTKITFSIKENFPDLKDLNLDIIEFIPKEIVKDAKMIIANPRADIIKNDPVIMWHINQDNTNISYEINKDVKVTGNTILLSKLISTKKSKEFPWRTLAPILLIPLIAGIIVFFGKYEPKTKK